MSPLSQYSLMPQSSNGSKRKSIKSPNGFRAATPIALVILLLGGISFSLPSILKFELEKQYSSGSHFEKTFPVSVNPFEKTIVENPAVEAFLQKQETPLSAAVANAQIVFTWLASEIASLPAYQQVASVAGSDTLFVTIHPGYRKEEVAQAFGNKLKWTAAQRTSFLANLKQPPTLTEGMLAPGTYAVSAHASPTDVHILIYDEFMKDIGGRYSSETAQVVPVADALTIASLLEREAAGPADMRLISGIIWNRLFVNMNLQIDATLQYAKAEKSKTTWWPTPVPNDKYIKSPYNTYMHAGLPPGPIASPSVAAVLAALNPKKTDCLFYFHDKYGEFHCSVTYKEHVALLKQYYGRGK